MNPAARLEARLTGSGAFHSLALAGVVGLIGIISLLLYILAGHDFGLLLCSLILGSFALFVAGVTLFQYFSRRPTLALDADGLHHLLMGSIDWRDVVGLSKFVMPGRTEGIPMLAVGLAKDARRRGAAPWVIIRGSPRQLRISLRSLDQSPERIFEVARALRDEVSPPRLEDWYFGMSQERQAAHRDSQRLLAGFERLAETAGRHHPQDESELQQLTQELDANTSELRRIQAVESSQFRRRMAFAWAAIALGILLVVLRVLLH